MLALCLLFAPTPGYAQTANITEDASSTSSTQNFADSPLKVQIDRLQGQVERLTEDFKDLSTLAADNSDDTSANNPTNPSWLAVIVKLQERLRVIEHTLTDLTARTEQLERFGGGEDDRIAQADSSNGVMQAQEQFDQARELLRARKIEPAIQAFQKFVQHNPSDARVAEAMFYLGESYAVMQDDKKAADAFLNGYKKNRKGDFAPKLLLRLGQTLAKLTKVEQACRVLKEFKKRFADADEQLTNIVESEIAANACGAG